MPIESEGNTSLILDGSGLSAIYQDKTIDLWAYVIEEEGYSDNMLDGRLIRKIFL